MSLRVWLPLNGDLTQQGTSGVTAIANNATVNTSGKIGSCYSFNNSNSYIELNGSELYSIIKGGSQPFSFCFWVYHADTTRAIIFGDYGLSGAIGFNIELGTNHSVRFYWNGSPDKTFNSQSYVTASGWTHIAITYNGSTLTIYKDGIASTDVWSGTLATKNKTSGVYYLGRDSRTGNTTLNGRLNDFRIYDHCLSAAEVKEIAQGLVLHYKLDQPANINNNLYTGSQNFTGTWVNSSVWTTSIETYQNFTVKQRSATWGGLAQNVPCAQGDIFTISFWGKVDSGGNIQSVHRSNLGNVTTGLTLLDGNFSSGTIWVNNSENGTQWKRYWGTVQITGSDVTYLQWRLENSVSGKNFYICGIKLEKGAAPSAWSLAASEAGETNIIYDSSGYNHNAASNGSAAVTLDSDTPKYLASTKFISGSRIAMPVASSTCLPTDAITVSIWYKSSAGTARFLSCTEGGGWNFEVNSSKASFPFYIKGKGYGRVIATQNFYSDNVWHMLTASYDGVSTAKIYLDGQLNNTTTITSGWENIPLAYNTSTPLTLGAEAQTITSPIAGTYVGNLSDLRIYCTALSDDTVLELYHTGAKIDNKQNLHCYEVKEDQSKIAITKQGNTFCNELNEESATKFYKTDKLIETNQIIEF